MKYIVIVMLLLQGCASYCWPVCDISGQSRFNNSNTGGSE